FEDLLDVAGDVFVDDQLAGVSAVVETPVGQGDQAQIAQGYRAAGAPGVRHHVAGHRGDLRGEGRRVDRAWAGPIRGRLGGGRGLLRRGRGRDGFPGDGGGCAGGGVRRGGAVRRAAGDRGGQERGCEEGGGAHTRGDPSGEFPS